jgi:hypothetical protein
MPCSAAASIGICFAGSLFYRLTVETRCAYKFALPAFAGSLALPMGWEALAKLVQGAAFSSLRAFGAACANLAPCLGYMAYVVLTVDYDVDHR